MEINGEATQGITHTRAIELIQAGGNRVHLLLRAGQGLVPDHSECGPAARTLGSSGWKPSSWLPCRRKQAVLLWMLMHVLPAAVLTCLSSHSASVSLSLPLLFDLLWFSASAQPSLPIYLLLL